MLRRTDGRVTISPSRAPRLALLLSRDATSCHDGEERLDFLSCCATGKIDWHSAVLGQFLATSHGNG